MQTLESQSRALKTRIFACFFQERNKKLPLAVGAKGPMTPFHKLLNLLQLWRHPFSGGGTTAQAELFLILDWLN